jgi:hypothetical protein
MGHVFDIGSQWDRAGRDGMTTLSFSLLRSFSFLLSPNPTTTTRHAEEHLVLFHPPYYPSCASALVGIRFRGSHSSDFYTCRF